MCQTDWLVAVLILCFCLWEKACEGCYLPAWCLRFLRGELLLDWYLLWLSDLPFQLIFFLLPLKLLL